MLTPHPGQHGAIVYDDAAPFFVATTVAFLARALDEGGAAVIIAADHHLSALAAALRERDRERVILRDVDELAARYLDTAPADRFERHIGALLRRASSSICADGGPKLHVYGELVSVLWRDGYGADAEALEQAWSDCVHDTGISELCGYAVRDLADTGEARVSLSSPVVRCHASVLVTPRNRGVAN